MNTVMAAVFSSFSLVIHLPSLKTYRAIRRRIRESYMHGGEVSYA